MIGIIELVSWFWAECQWWCGNGVLWRERRRC